MTTETPKLTRILYYEYLPGVLERKRKELGLSQEQAGERTGLHGVTICRIEQGTNADYASVVRYCDTLEIPVSDVILQQVETGARRGARKKLVRQTT